MFRKISPSGTPPLTLTIDGQPVTAERGETVASVLMRQSEPACRNTPVHGSPRAPFCMMGVCFDCMAIVDGVSSTQTCLVTVDQGMCVERLLGRPAVAS
jgi:D-hydroxyproline dehydrogenase subunit gamma